MGLWRIVLPFKGNIGFHGAAEIAALTNVVKTFTEDTRVKIPALLHLTRLGYTYLSLKKATWDEATNIFTEIFRNSLARINQDAAEEDIDSLVLFRPRH